MNSLAFTISEPVADIWDLLGVSITAAAASFLLAMDFKVKKKNS